MSDTARYPIPTMRLAIIRLIGKGNRDDGGRGGPAGLIQRGGRAARLASGWAPASAGQAARGDMWGMRGQ